MSLLEYHDWLSRSGIFDNIVIWSSTFPRITQTDDPVSIQVYRTSRGVFSLLGVRPLLGRGFEPQDERVGADSPVAGCIASYVPARRATHVDPLVAMRH